MNFQKEAQKNTLELRRIFIKLLDDASEKGDIGVSSFKVVFDELIDEQKEKLRELTLDQFNSL